MEFLIIFLSYVWKLIQKLLWAIARTIFYSFYWLVLLLICFTILGLIFLILGYASSWMFGGSMAIGFVFGQGVLVFFFLFLFLIFTIGLWGEIAYKYRVMRKKISKSWNDHKEEYQEKKDNKK